MLVHMRWRQNNNFKQEQVFSNISKIFCTSISKYIFIDTYVLDCTKMFFKQKSDQRHWNSSWRTAAHNTYSYKVSAQQTHSAGKEKVDHAALD